MTGGPTLAERVEAQFALPEEALGAEARAVFDAFLAGLERGEIRAAEPGPDGWRVNGWVKQGILLGFRIGRVRESPPAGPLRFFDKDTFPPGTSPWPRECASSPAARRSAPGRTSGRAWW